MSMPIGLWIPHSSELCPGYWNVPSVLTRMHYVLTEVSGLYIPSGCLANLYAGNDALSMYQNAQLTVSFTLAIGSNLDLTLFVGGTYSFQPIVQVDGVTRLSSAGYVRLALSSGSHTLIFSINPMAPGTVSTNGITLSAMLLR